MTTFVVVVPDTLGVGRLGEGQSFLLDVDHLGLLRLLARHRAGLGDAELEEKVEVVEATMFPDKMSEVELRVLSVIIYLGLAKDTDNPIGRIAWPAGIHVDASG